MSSYQECAGYVKHIAKVSDFENKTYCQKLDICSREFGFNSYYDFKHTFPKFSGSRVRDVSLKIEKKYCSIAHPKSSIDYYFFTAHNPRGFSYYSHWIGFDTFGEEVRVPSLIKAGRIVELYREESDISSTIYVVEKDAQCLHWMFYWKGKAVIAKELAEKRFPSFFNQRWRVCEDVDSKLIQKAYLNKKQLT